MTFLDANIFLFAALDQGAIGQWARKRLAQVSPKAPATTSALVLNEVYWNLRRPQGREAALRESERLLGIPGLHVLPVKATHWAHALRLMGQHGHLKPHDALHAAVALDEGAAMVSTDSDFDGIPGLRREKPA